MLAIGGIDHVAIRVHEMDRAIAWYERVLGARHVYADHPDFGIDPAMLKLPCGGPKQYLALIPHDAPHTKVGAAVEVCAERGKVVVLDHIAFRVTEEEFEANHVILEKEGIDHVVEDHGLQLSMYLRDPEHNLLEITAWREHLLPTE